MAHTLLVTPEKCLEVDVWFLDTYDVVFVFRVERFTMDFLHFAAIF